MVKQSRRALILCSGGPDSVTLARVAEHEGRNLAAAVYLRTGNRSDAKEIAAARRVATRLGIPFEVMDITDAVKKLGVARIMPHASAHIAEFGLVVSLSIAIACAKTVEANEVLIALHMDDYRMNPRQYSQHFLDHINRLANLAGAAEVVAPFLNMSKADVFKLGMKLGVDYSETWSCSESDDVHCGRCGACIARQKAFSDAAIEDRTAYKSLQQAVGVA